MVQVERLNMAVAVLFIMLAASVVGCTANPARQPAAFSPPPSANSIGDMSAARSATAEAQATSADPASSAESDITGVWQGTTLANCNMSRPSRCNAQQKVTITLVPGRDSTLTGKYKCSYGNMNCYNLNETGKVAKVTTTGKLMTIRVMMRDGTSCVFTGRNVNNAVNGGYSCYGGGSRIEQGSWRARRAY